MSKEEVYVFDPESGKKFQEKIWGKEAIFFLYQNTLVSRIGRFLVARLPFVSFLYGLYHKMPWTKSLIPSFIQKFSIEMNDFEERNFSSFSDFFTRKLREGARPVAPTPVISPADGRMMFFSTFPTRGLYVKGKTLSKRQFFDDAELEKQFGKGSVIVIRLAPPDYHRFHAPIEGIISRVKKKRGALFSVNPIALRKIPGILAENKRVHLVIEGATSVCMTLVGATNVGSIRLHVREGQKVHKGEELGFFDLGASMIVLSFQKKRKILEKKTGQKEEVLIKVNAPLP